MRTPIASQAISQRFIILITITATTAQETRLHFAILATKEHTITTTAIVNLGIGCGEVGQPSKGVDKDSAS